MEKFIGSYWSLPYDYWNTMITELHENSLTLTSSSLKVAFWFHLKKKPNEIPLLVKHLLNFIFHSFTKSGYKQLLKLCNNEKIKYFKPIPDSIEAIQQKKIRFKESAQVSCRLQAKLNYIHCLLNLYESIF